MRRLTPSSQDGLSIAEAFVLLSLAPPKRGHSIAWWSDIDYALAGAHIIDLSFQNEVDTDSDTVTRLQGHTVNEPQESVALRVLDELGGKAPLDAVINEVVSRIGDLRSATLASLATKKILQFRRHKIVWAFMQPQIADANVPEAQSLREELAALIEGGELPDAEQASLFSLLYACGMTGPVLGGSNPKKWLTRNRKRVDTIRRMDLVGRAVADVIIQMRERLRTYVLESDGSSRNGPSSGEGEAK